MATPTSQRSGCLGALLRLFQRPQPYRNVPYVPVEEEFDERLPYRLRDDFLSPTELSYYSVLRSVVGPRATICAKVRLADVLFVARPNENRSYFNRIAQRHVDFLMCESSTMQPVLVIELDDSSHQRPDRAQADEFLNEALEAAALPLLRVAPKRAYTQEEVIAGLRPLIEAINLAASQADAPTNGIEEEESTPLCPKCGIPMVLRTAGRGPQKGTQFYGCRNFPECRQMLPLRSPSAAG
jgi:hypothetical protein